jgi:hypothetical protein
MMCSSPVYFAILSMLVSFTPVARLQWHWCQSPWNSKWAAPMRHWTSSVHESSCHLSWYLTGSHRFKVPLPLNNTTGWDQTFNMWAFGVHLLIQTIELPTGIIMSLLLLRAKGCLLAYAISDSCHLRILESFLTVMPGVQNIDTAELLSKGGALHL